MKHPSLVPITIGLLAATVAPLQAVAADPQPIEFTLPSDQQAVAPSIPDEVPAEQEADQEPVTVPAEVPVIQTAQPSAATAPASVALNFDPPQAGAVAAVVSPASAPPTSPSPSSSPAPSAPPAPTNPGTAALFAGNSDSMVARVVGAAEGTRSADGGKTSLYEGHTDPGNGVWNRGTFSYQFGNAENLSAEEADQRQMAKIKRIHETVLLVKAAKLGLMPLTLAEELNGIDLINQAPLAVTEVGGYVERLAEAKQKKGLMGEEAILDARIWAFWDANKGGWDAPGLRAYDDMGKEESIRQDQRRRMGMITQALASFEHQQGAIANARSGAQPPSSPNQNVAASSPARLSVTAHPDSVADLIIFQNKMPRLEHRASRISSNFPS